MFAPDRRRLFLVLLIVLLISPPPPAAHGLDFRRWTKLISLSHSLMLRVANARATRGDLLGAERAHKIADNLRLLGIGNRSIFSASWDFLWNYAWPRRGSGFHLAAEISAAAADLFGALGEAARLGSGAERAAWMLRNGRRLRSLSTSLIQSLLQTFSQSGPLRDAVLVMQREVVEGELLRDCLEIGAADLEGLLRVARDLLNSYSSNHSEL